jgi:hypothetical protein
MRHTPWMLTALLVACAGDKSTDTPSTTDTSDSGTPTTSDTTVELGEPDPGLVNGYMTFFFNTGHEHAGLNFLSPDTGTLDVDLAGGRWTSAIPTASWTDEGGSATTVEVRGTVDAEWSP